MLPMKALAGVGRQARRVVVPAAWNRKAVIVSTVRPSSRRGPGERALDHWTTLTTTAAMPGHFTRRRAA